MQFKKKHLGWGLLLLIGGISVMMQLPISDKAQVENTEVIEEAQEVWVDRVDKGLILDEVLVGGQVEYYDEEAKKNGPYIKAWIYPDSIDKIAEGQAIRIYAHDENEIVVLNGCLDYIADVEIDEHYEGKISYTNEKKLYLPMVPEMYIVVNQKEDAIRIPLDAVVSREDGDYVYKVKDGIVQEEKIQLGMKALFQAELLEGHIEEGDLLVTYDKNYLKNYDSVIVIEHDFRPTFD